MKKWRLIDIREYRKEGWFEICQPSWQVYYHKYGEEGRRKCSLLEKLQILGTAIWGACHGMKFSSKLMLSARILILFIAQSLNLPHSIECKLWNKDFVRIS